MDLINKVSNKWQKKFLSLLKQYLYGKKDLMPNMSKLRKENFLVKSFLDKSLEKSQKMEFISFVFNVIWEKNKMKISPRSNRVRRSFSSFQWLFSYKTHHNFARKQNFLSEHIKVLPGRLKIRKIGLKNFTHLYLLNKLC